MPSKSIYRQPGAKKFQLVHRSQRDPLIHDPEASQYVFKELETKNAKGKLSTTDSGTFDADDTDDGPAGKAALYGIYYDDRDYDYTQHLRAIGVEEKGVESILIEAPSKPQRKPKKLSASDLIPHDALPSQKELPRTYESQQAIPSSISGFQPDMDPHLRQTLEALDDEAFVDSNLDDDFFGELLEEGERGDDDDDPDFEFHEDGLPDEAEDEHMEGEEEDDNWEKRFARFKLQQKKRLDKGSMLEGMSEGGDTLGRLPNLSVAGAKKRRRKDTSDASGYSMSSSSMFRNEGLTRLDEQFERFEADYASDQMGEDEDHSDDEAPPLITTREDFEAVLDEFLAQEQVGNKLVQRLEGGTPKERLNTLRRAFVSDDDKDDEWIRKEALLNREDKETTSIPMPVDIDQEKERWDCETILTTYSNLENHPRLLRLTQPKRTKKILLDSKTGLPSVAESEIPQEDREEEREGDSTGDDEDIPAKGTTTRPKNETTEEKRARKQALKKERQERRQQKKQSKDVFAQERKQQNKSLTGRQQTGIRKL
ncbi:hypothetical protein FRC17_010010 [Serendipita sp. 399]|nr:hypothetical protein FRC17_010010 [Serendipita sp. 399]